MMNVVKNVLKKVKTAGKKATMVFVRATGRNLEDFLQMLFSSPEQLLPFIFFFFVIPFIFHLFKESFTKEQESDEKEKHADCSNQHVKRKEQ